MNISGIRYLYEIGGKKTQEDFIWPKPGAATVKDRVFIVCDGVGGSENGEIASRLVAEFTGRTLTGTKEDDLSVGAINEILGQAQLQLISYADSHKLSGDMATTFTLLKLFDSRAFIAWCGDSRVYQFRNGVVVQETRDHSLVNSLVQSGAISAEEARSHPQKNIILRAIKGDGSPIEAEGFWIEDVKPGDDFVLCTDGLLENISGPEFKILLNGRKTGHPDVEMEFQKLCFNKTRDNYSMYLVELAAGTPPKRRRRPKNRMIVWLLAVLLVLIVFFITLDRTRHGAFAPKNAPRSISPAAEPDSLPILEKEGPSTDSAVSEPDKSDNP